MQIHTIGVDLGKTVFHLVGLNLRGEVVVRRKCSRTQLLQFTANAQVDLIGMEACAGAHFMGRALREQGHEVRIIPAQYVKPYVKTNKSDFIDAEAIAEAVGRPTMRFVPIKTDDQLDMQSLHRVRERWVIRRTAVVNQIRGLLLERGITLRQGRRHLEAALPGILEDATTRLSGSLRMLISQLKHELEELANFIGEADGVMERTSRENESCRRLLSIPCIGPVTATALIAAIGNGASFRKAESSQPGSVWCRRVLHRRKAEASGHQGNRLRDFPHPQFTDDDLAKFPARDGLRRCSDALGLGAGGHGWNALLLYRQQVCARPLFCCSPELGEAP